MIEEKKKATPTLVKENVLKMKGQAIPLFSYHILRDHLLTAITGEHESAILYWGGKDLAQQLNIQSYEECIDLYLELGWGYLESQQTNSQTKRFKLTSPYFAARDLNNKHSTFALECGFLTEAVANIENKDTEGEFEVHSNPQELHVLITIRLAEKNRPS